MAFRDLIESKKYLKVRKKYLETTATFPNRKLDARVNSLLHASAVPYDAILQEVHGGIPARKPKDNNIIMDNKERSPRKEKKKPKKQKR